MDTKAEQPNPELTEPAARQARGVVIFDVDGVIFKGQFILALSRRAPLATAFAVLSDGFLFNVGRLPLRELLVRSYRGLRGLPASVLYEVFHSMPRTPGARETISQLKAHNWCVLLLSSGVPHELVQELARQLGADEGAGIELGRTGGKLNGRVGGLLTRPDGKVAFVSKWLSEHGYRWDQAVCVGDDDSNLGLMARASLSVGIRATLAVRRHADFLGDRRNLASILPVVLTGAAPQRRFAVLGELLRRFIHLTAFLWPFVARSHLQTAWTVLGTACLLYCFSEYLRLNGLTLPAFGTVTRTTIREGERRRFALAPLTLAGGVALSLLFPPPIPFVAVGVAAFGDALGGLVGQMCGKVPLLWNQQKTLEGTLSAFAAAAVVSACFLPTSVALLVAAAGALVESLPLGDWDNFFVPLLVGFAALLLRGL